MVTLELLRIFFGKNFVHKGGGTPLTDKIRKVVFEVPPKLKKKIILIYHLPHSMALMNVTIQRDKHCCNCNILLLGVICESIIKVSPFYFLKI